MPGRNGTDGTVKSVRLGDISPKIKRDHPRRRRRGINSTCQQRLDLGGEAQTFAIIGVIQRLDAEGVTRQPQTALARIPERKREHAAQALHETLPFKRIQVQKRLGIAVAVIARAARFAPGAQLRMIVDFAVENNQQLPIFRRHGLGRAFTQINDREPTMGEADAALRIRP